METDSIRITDLPEDVLGYIGSMLTRRLDLAAMCLTCKLFATACCPRVCTDVAKIQEDSYDTVRVAARTQLDLEKLAVHIGQQARLHSLRMTLGFRPEACHTRDLGADAALKAIAVAFPRNQLRVLEFKQVSMFDLGFIAAVVRRSAESLRKFRLEWDQRGIPVPRSLPTWTSAPGTAGDDGREQFDPDRTEVTELIGSLAGCALLDSLKLRLHPSGHADALLEELQNFLPAKQGRRLPRVYWHLRSLALTECGPGFGLEHGQLCPYASTLERLELAPLHPHSTCFGVTVTMRALRTLRVHLSPGRTSGGRTAVLDAVLMRLQKGTFPNIQTCIVTADQGAQQVPLATFQRFCDAVGHSPPPRLRQLSVPVAAGALYSVGRTAPLWQRLERVGPPYVAQFVVQQSSESGRDALRLTALPLALRTAADVPAAGLPRRLRVLHIELTMESRDEAALALDALAARLEADAAVVRGLRRFKLRRQWVVAAAVRRRTPASLPFQALECEWLAQGQRMSAPLKAALRRLLPLLGPELGFLSLELPPGLGADAALGALSDEAAAAVRHLSLHVRSSCVDVLAAAAARLPQLRTLKVSVLERLQSAGRARLTLPAGDLAALIRGCPRLHSLSLRGGVSFAPDWAAAADVLVRERPRALRCLHVQLRGQPPPSEAVAALARIREALPEVDVFPEYGH